MKAAGYAQIQIYRDAEGKAEDAAIVHVTQSFPRRPKPGAIVARLVVDIPEALTNVQTYEAVAKAGALTFVIEEEE